MTDLRKAAEMSLEALIENARLLGATQAKKGFGCYSQEDAMLERAWHEGIAKHSAFLRTALAEPHGPVAWRFKTGPSRLWALTGDGYYAGCMRDSGYTVEPLYANPAPQRNPLSDAEIEAIAVETEDAGHGWAGDMHHISNHGFFTADSLRAFVRAVEKAYGIT